MKAKDIINYLCENYIPRQLRGTINVFEPTNGIELFPDIVDDVTIEPGAYFYMRSEFSMLDRPGLEKYGVIDYELPAPRFAAYFIVRIA